MEEEMRRDVPRRCPFPCVGDVNGLKITNDVFGHQMGDKLKAFRTIKGLQKGRYCSQVGGDEF